ncbi:MAG: murein biosynthesis integral membrane protein MurJ [Candidatus Fermentibacteraceae bacterium]|nr:murein biosynthesis integral membrane protein MurJ [Candidatus Fermentibacteraceae bacterium]
MTGPDRMDPFEDLDDTGSVEDLGTPGQEATRIARATGLMGGLTVTSRILGLLRDVAQAAILGTGMAADAFTLGFIIPNTLRRLFGESTTSAAFVPTYVETLGRDSRKDAFRLGSRVLTLVGTVLLALVILGMIGAPLLVRLFAPGFGEIPGKTELATDLLRLLFPYILVVGCAAIVGGILNAHRHFMAPASAPILFNLSALFGILLLSRWIVPGQPVWGYSIGVLAGGVLQLLVQIPALRRRGFSFKLDFNWTSPKVRRIGKLAFPALVGLLAAEVNIIVDKMIASMLEPGSVAALAYGNRIMQFPQGVFAISLATALLPTLSRQTASGKLGDAGKTLGRATLALAALMVPATMCMVLLAGPLVQVLLARGAFTAESTILTSSALVYYSAGLLFYGAVKITAPVFYAMKDTRTPVKIAVGCMGLNIILNIVFTLFFIRTGLAKPLAGLALATSVASMVNFFVLRIALRKRAGPVVQSSRAAWLAMLPAGGAALLILLLLSPWVDAASSSSTLEGLGSILAASAASIASFLGVFALMGGGMARSVFSLAFRRGH